MTNQTIKKLNTFFRILYVKISALMGHILCLIITAAYEILQKHLLKYTVNAIAFIIISSDFSQQEEEISAGTDGSFGKHKLFSCPPKKAFFVPLYKCRKDKRFMEVGGRSMTGNNFGSIETPDVCGNISPPDSLGLDTIITNVCGKQKGIQGHHNSCYLDATLFAMFYFTTVFDGILYRPKTKEDLAEYDDVKQVIKEGIVNPLRR